MSTLTETPPTPAEDEPSLRTSLVRSLGSAVGLVVLVAAIFGVIGMIGRAETPTPVAADLPATEDEAATDDPGDAEPEPTAPVDEATDPVDEDAAAEDAVAEDEAADENAGEDETETSDADEVAAAEPEPEPEPEPQETQTAAATIPPGDVSIQVLDGYKADGGTAARSVAHELREAGYRVVAENQALTYETTTVLWTAGHEAAARQVARQIGAAEVREQPGNLSSAVDVHVVVGGDRG